jgi:hypothetical protein
MLGAAALLNRTLPCTFALPAAGFSFSTPVPERVVFLSAFVFVAELPEVGELEFAFLFPPEDLQPKAIANKSIVATIEFRLAADIFLIPLGVLIERLGIFLT